MKVLQRVAVVVAAAAAVPLPTVAASANHDAGTIVERSQRFFEAGRSRRLASNSSAIPGSVVGWCEDVQASWAAAGLIGELVFEPKFACSPSAKTKGGYEMVSKDRCDRCVDNNAACYNLVWTESYIPDASQASGYRDDSRACVDSGKFSTFCWNATEQGLFETVYLNDKQCQSKTRCNPNAASTVQKLYTFDCGNVVAGAKLSMCSAKESNFVGSAKDFEPMFQSNFYSSGGTGSANVTIPPIANCRAIPTPTCNAFDGTCAPINNPIIPIIEKCDCSNLGNSSATLDCEYCKLCRLGSCGTLYFSERIDSNKAFLRFQGSYSFFKFTYTSGKVPAGSYIAILQDYTSTQCSIAVNGKECKSCVRNIGCGTGRRYGQFKADCTNLPGGRVFNLCNNVTVGNDTSPFIFMDDRFRNSIFGYLDPQYTGELAACEKSGGNASVSSASCVPAGAETSASPGRWMTLSAILLAGVTALWGLL